MLAARGREASELVIPDEVLPSVFEVLDLPALLKAGAARHRWRNAAAIGGTWKEFFATRWRNRQKPESVRKCWLALLQAGDAVAPSLTLTADTMPPAGHIRKKAALEVHSVGDFVSPNPGSWHDRFMRAEADRWRPKIRASELCDDAICDPYGKHDTSCSTRRYFPRRWVITAGALHEEFLGDELQFNADGSIEARSCLLLLAPSPETRWRWRFSGGDSAIVEVFGEPEAGVPVVVSFEVSRSFDAGFILRAKGPWPSGLTLCSREKTLEEHMYRCYGAVGFPIQLQRVLIGVATGEFGTPYFFPPSLTSFERLAVHRCAEALWLRHDSRGIGLGRQIVVWRPDTPEEDFPTDDEHFRR
eukprot:gnl/TRDRNA2_/TRDRNA2_27638_c0_seq1.p1 gnl/TRDRNA2_/TRDRNA2_27638_c0~~gnl/TRDRNA2_/TRDRNA2_27638_c0_seq1.p1  ORF type:complete len:359 (+),score=56.72 gnl/TRDRNA2_/TRDRNA2_27638_c0_seq1:66-1142(+)